MNQCQIPTAENNILAKVFTEKVSEGLDSLPGNVEIKAGPEYAKGAAAVTSVPPAVVPTLEYSSAPAVDPSKAYLPGAVLIETGKPETTTATPEPVPTTSSSVASIPTEVNVKAAEVVTSSPPATTAPPSSIPENTHSFISTEYITKGREVVHVLWVEELVTVTGTVTTTATMLGDVTSTVLTTTTMLSERKRHMHQHRRGGRMR